MTTRWSAALLAAALAAGACEDARRPPPSGAGPARIVTIGGTVTETVFALGLGARVVGVDTSSVHPPAVAALTKVGYQRRFSAEGVLSLRPTAVVASSEAGPPASFEQLRAAGVPSAVIPSDHGVEGARARIRAIARAVGAGAAGETLVARMDRELAAARGAVATSKGSAPRVLFVYARGQGTVQVAGSETAADEIIRLAGAVNAVSGFTGFRPLTPEAAAAAQPEIIVVPERGLESLGGRKALLALPGLSLTEAARAGRVVTLDDLLMLGFGPRLGQAVAELGARLRQARQPAPGRAL